MNTQQEQKHTKYFARQWLEDVLIHCRGCRGFLLQLRIKAHLNSRYTSLNNGKMLDMEKFIRIVVNLAMVVGKDDFMKLWIKMGEIICDFAEGHGKEFNDMYGKTQNKKDKAHKNTITNVQKKKQYE